MSVLVKSAELNPNCTPLSGLWLISNETANHEIKTLWNTNRLLNCHSYIFIDTYTNYLYIQTHVSAC